MPLFAVEIAAVLSTHRCGGRREQVSEMGAIISWIRS
jgi:hypothetical protein